MKSSLLNKPQSRPPVFERLTQNLTHNSIQKKSKRERSQKQLDEVNRLSRPKKIHFVANMGDTGSSFDRIIERGYYENNPYDADYSTYSMKPKSNNRTFQYKSYAAHSKNKISMDRSILRESPERRDVVQNYDVKSQAGKVQSKGKKINQDSYICQRISDHWMFGVLDGHGLYGHHASALAKRMLPKYIFKKNKKNTQVSTSISSKKQMNTKLNKTDITEGFKTVHKYFDDEKCSFDPSFSGTTVNIVFMNSQDRKLL